MPNDSAQNFSPRQLTKLYILSLLAVASLSILGQTAVQYLLARQSVDIKVISVAQQRQQLCQRLLKTAMMVQLPQDPKARELGRSALQSTIADWESSAQAIREELKTAFSEEDLVELKPVFQKLQPAAKEITRATKAVLAQPDPLPNPPQRGQRLRDRTPLQPANLITPGLIAAEQAYTRGVDEVINWYSNKIQQRVQQLRLLEYGLLGLTLGVLALEGLLIFRPAVRKLQQTMTALAMSLKETQETARRLAAEQEKSERLLLNILPEPIADRLKQEPQAIADGFGEVTILFADIVGFTEMSNRMSPTEIVSRLNQIFSRFDTLVEKHDLEKIKTIGDAYMVVGGLPEPRADHAIAIAELAIDMQKAIQELNQQTGESFSMRMGINTGPVVAGVIGIKKFIYDLWGDTVNVASRMEMHGLPGRIHVTEATYRYLQDSYRFEERGMIAVKGKGQMKTYWLLERANRLARV